MRKDWKIDVNRITVLDDRVVVKFEPGDICPIEAMNYRGYGYRKTAHTGIVAKEIKTLNMSTVWKLGPREGLITRIRDYGFYPYPLADWYKLWEPKTTELGEYSL